jgi:poly(A) polymerase Pap1
MGTFKITNITNLASKRDFKYKSILDIDYVDKMTKKVISIKPGDVVYLTVSSLPLSAHRLRVKNLITVDEIDGTELAISMNNIKTKTVTKEVIDDEEKKSVQKSKKKSVKKEEETDTEIDIPHI